MPFRTWRVNGQLMLLQLGVGFDGLLMWRTPRRVKRALGFVGVVLSALRQGVTFDYPRTRVTGELEDGSTKSVVVTSALIANAKRSLHLPSSARESPSGPARPAAQWGPAMTPA